MLGALKPKGPEREKKISLNSSTTVIYKYIQTNVRTHARTHIQKKITLDQCRRSRSVERIITRIHTDTTLHNNTKTERHG